MIKLELNPPGTVACLSIGHGRGDASYRDINDAGAAQLAAADQLCGLRIDAPAMPRPRQLLDLLEHLPALRDAASRIQRVAVLSDSPPREFVPVLRGHFEASEVRHFSAAASRAADQWVQSANEAEEAGPEAPAPAAATVVADLQLDDGLVDEASGPSPDDDIITLDDDAASSVDDEIDDWFVKS